MSAMRSAAVLLVACVAAGVPARAQNNARVEAEHQRGLALRRDGRHEEARQLFQRLWESTREPRALARMALAEAALGLWVDAEAHLADALTRAQDPWIRENRASLGANLEAQRARVGDVEVRCEAPGARASVRGAPEVLLPMRSPARVPVGQVAVEVTAPGYRAERRIVEARPLATGLLVVYVTLTPARPVEPPRPAPTPAPTPAASSGGALRAAGYTLLGVGAILAGLATWQYVTAAGVASDASAATAASEEPYRSWYLYASQQQSATTADALCERAAADAVSPAAAQSREPCRRIDAANALAVGFLVPALASLAAGAVMVAVAPRRAVTPRATLAPVALPGGAGLTLSGRF